MSIREHVQRADLGAAVELYILDLTLYGLGVMRLVKADEGNPAAVMFDEEEYTPYPVRSEGWAVTSEGAAARPTIAFANVSGIFTAIVAQNNNLKGCTVKRICTYERFLDDGEEPDPSQILPIDEYVINRKSGDDGDVIQFELTAELDVEGAMIPARTANRDYCDNSYRYRVGGVFVYTNVTCPWAGSTYYKDDDSPTTDPAEDKCGFRVSSCKLRFGENAQLPFGGFAGLARVRSG